MTPSALRILEAAGLSRSAAIRAALSASAERVSRKGVGHEQQGERFGVIVQVDSMLARSVIVVAPTSTSARPASFRPVVSIAGETRRVLVERLGAVEAQRLGRRVGQLAADDMWAVDEAPDLVKALLCALRQEATDASASQFRVDSEVVDPTTLAIHLCRELAVTSPVAIRNHPKSPISHRCSCHRNSRRFPARAASICSTIEEGLVVGAVWHRLTLANGMAADEDDRQTKSSCGCVMRPLARVVALLLGNSGVPPEYAGARPTHLARNRVATSDPSPASTSG